MPKIASGHPTMSPCSAGNLPLHCLLLLYSLSPRRQAACVEQLEEPWAVVLHCAHGMIIRSWLNTADDEQNSPSVDGPRTGLEVWWPSPAAPLLSGADLIAGHILIGWRSSVNSAPRCSNKSCLCFARRRRRRRRRLSGTRPARTSYALTSHLKRSTAVIRNIRPRRLITSTTFQLVVLFLGAAGQHHHHQTAPSHVGRRTRFSTRKQNGNDCQALRSSDNFVSTDYRPCASADIAWHFPPLAFSLFSTFHHYLISSITFPSLH